jgi:hypothetical protein
MKRLTLFLSLLLVLLLATESWAAVVYDNNVAVTNQATLSATTCVTPSITVNSNSNRLATVEITFDGDADTSYTVSSVTGGSLTWVQDGFTAGTSSEDYSGGLWHAVAPASGGLVVTVTFSPGLAVNDDMACAARSFSGVNQSTPTSGYAGNYNDVSGIPSQAITTTTGDHVIAAVGARSDFSTATGCNVSQDYSATNNRYHFGGHCDSDAASETISYTLTSANTHIIVGMNIKASGGAAPAQFFRRRGP